MLAREVPAIAATTASVREHAFVIVFGSLLFCTGERCADLHIVVVIAVVVFEGIGLYMEKFGQLFLNGARHRASVDGKKIACMRRHTIFYSYCHYYYRMTTVATAVIMR